MKEFNGQSKDILQNNIDSLKHLFPEVFTEDKIDFDRLRDVLGDYVDDRDERYRFEWNGKSQALRMAQTQSTGTLRPCKAESKDWDTTENLYIEGDNLEVLKLLQKSYHNSIKMIYIDPPYNTGKDFVYPDNYRDNMQNYLELTGQVDGENKKISTNSETSGRYHTDWLNMMYPRLRLARNLLTDDGVIFISIDDNEVDNLKKICNEIFGEENFVANIVWKHTQQSKNDERHFSRQYNHTLVYAKIIYLLHDFYFERTKEDNKNYSNKDNDPKGMWRSGDVRSPNYRKTLCYNIEAPNGNIIEAPANGWRWSQESVKEKIASGEIIFKEDNTGIIRKIYLVDQKGRTPENLWAGDKYSTTRNATSVIKDLFNGVQVFDTPKPYELVKSMESIATNEYSVILDFFSGSATTAHATMKLNAEDGGNRKFIMVQLPEPTDEKSEANKAGYINICEIGKERIRRAGDKIKNEIQGQQLKIGEEPKEVPDIGFKVFKLDSSNLKKWNPDYDNLEKTMMDMVSNYVEARTEEDVLYEIMLKYGVDLTLPMETELVNGKKVFNIGFGALFICLDDNIEMDVAEFIIAKKNELQPEITRVVFKDNGFKDDSTKTNVEMKLERAGFDNVLSV